MLLPFGHDQRVYGRSWATWALIALNGVVFALVALTYGSEQERAEQAVARLEETLGAYPNARVSPYQLRRLPDGLAEQLVARAEGSGGQEGDQEVDAALTTLSKTVERLPAVRFGYRPNKPSLKTAITSLFVHADFWHLASNMLFLWLSGVVIECFWERRRYLMLYFGSGVVAVLAHHLAQAKSMTPLVGASGAIAGIMGAFLIGYPRTRINLLTLLGPLRLPAWLLLPAWVLVELGHGLIGSNLGVAHWAHVGGFAFGAVAAVVANRLNLVFVDGGSYDKP